MGVPEVIEVDEPGGGYVVAETLGDCWYVWVVVWGYQVCDSALVQVGAQEPQLLLLSVVFDQYHA